MRQDYEIKSFVKTDLNLSTINNDNEWAIKYFCSIIGFNRYKNFTKLSESQFCQLDARFVDEFGSECERIVRFTDGNYGVLLDEFDGKKLVKLLIDEFENGGLEHIKNCIKNHTLYETNIKK